MIWHRQRKFPVSSFIRRDILSLSLAAYGGYLHSYKDHIVHSIAIICGTGLIYAAIRKTRGRNEHRSIRVGGLADRHTKQLRTTAKFRVQQIVGMHFNNIFQKLMLRFFDITVPCCLFGLFYPKWTAGIAE